jgi:RNA polymerase sigma-70 factor (sigma-E family)
VTGGTFDEFARAEHAPLTRYAYLLTGDADAAQDLAQETLVRVLVKWRHVAAADSPGAYARRVMLSLFVQGQRRRWRREIPSTEAPDTAGTSDGAAGVEDRDLIVRLLRRLPARQRAAVLLRHYEQRSEAETAAAMGCSVGTVKSLTSRGLAALRALEPTAARSGDR